MLERYIFVEENCFLREISSKTSFPVRMGLYSNNKKGFKRNLMSLCLA